MADKKDQQTEQNVDQTVEQQQAEQQAAQAAEEAMQQDTTAAEAETAGTSADQTDKIAELELALSKAEAQAKDQRESVLLKWKTYDVVQVRTWKKRISSR